MPTLAPRLLHERDYLNALDELFRLGKELGFTWMEWRTEGPGAIDASTRCFGAPRRTE